MENEQPEEIITRRAAVIVAHPDDETLGAGGVIQEPADWIGEGERGGWQSPVTRGVLRQARADEGRGTAETPLERLLAGCRALAATGRRK